MQILRDKPILAWGFLVIALLVLFASYYLFVWRPAQPTVPPAPVETPTQPPSSNASGGQAVPY
jgi:type II secretory pathway component PulM